MLLILSFSYYGLQVGNFVITIDNEKSRSIGICDNRELKNITSRLTAEPLSKCIDAQISDIPSNIEEGDGSKNDNRNGRYFAYSLYIVNNGDEKYDYEVLVDIDKATKAIDTILRIMLIKTEYENFEDNIKLRETKTVYALSDKDGNPEYITTDGYRTYGYTDDLGYKYPEQTTPFKKDHAVSFISRGLASNNVEKYTIVLWLEGWDKDQTDEMLGGSIKISMDFKIL